MKRIYPLLILMCAASTAWSGHDIKIVGTAYSIIYRGPAQSPATQATATPQPAERPAHVLPRYPTMVGPGTRVVVPRYPTPAQPTRTPQPNEALLRLVLAKTGQEVARAGFDRQIDGWMFSLPMLPAAASPVCFVIKDSASRAIPLRDESQGDDGYTFHNPRWEDEARRLTELVSLRAELSQLDAQLAGERTELEQIEGELQRTGASGPGACPLPAAPAEPVRPAAALEPAQARQISGGVCALKWEPLLAKAGAADWARFYADAGLADDWNARANARTIEPAMTEVSLPGTASDLRLVAEAAIKGRTYLEHEQGLRLFARLQGTCRDSVQQAADQALRKWQASRAESQLLPRKQQKQCEARVIRVEQLRSAHAKAPAYRAELQERIAQLNQGSASATESSRLDRQTCREF